MSQIFPIFWTFWSEITDLVSTQDHKLTMRILTFFLGFSAKTRFEKSLFYKTFLITGILILVFRPEKEGYELMRAALPHLRLLTIKTEQLSNLSKYLLPEEKIYLGVQVVFKEDLRAAPPPATVNTNKYPRPTFTPPSPKVLHLIPSPLINTKYNKLEGVEVRQVERDSKFCLRVHVCQSFCLKEVEILTRASR